MFADRKVSAINFYFDWFALELNISFPLHFATLKAFILIIKTFQECLKKAFHENSSICLFTSVSSWLKHIGTAILTGIIDESCRENMETFEIESFVWKHSSQQSTADWPRKKRRKTFSSFFYDGKKVIFSEDCQWLLREKFSWRAQCHNMRSNKDEKKGNKILSAERKSKLKNVLGIKKFIAVRGTWNL